METKPLTYGIIGFLLGGLIVSIAATQFSAQPDQNNSLTMNQMAKNLEGKTGDEFDEAFLAGMIGHHEGALDMAKQSASSAKHDEIKKLSLDIIAAQESEIATMKQWQKDWGYDATDAGHSDQSH